jgi:predicted ester cyclase
MNNMFRAFPDWHAEPVGPLVHADDGVFLEMRMTGTQHDEWTGIPSSGGHMDVRLAVMYDFEADELITERVWFDMATVTNQLAAPQKKGD